METQKVLPLWVRVNLGAMAKKGHSIFPRAPKLVTHHQMKFCVIPRITFLMEVGAMSYPSARDTISEF